MSNSKIIRSDWHADDRLIITQISGDIVKEDVTRWEQTLDAALDQIPESGVFKIFVNLHGFTAADIDTHKYFRDIIPRTLAHYGWKVGYVAMFPQEAEKMIITRKRDIQCIAAAHCHHDATKIEKYELLYSSDNERFFTDVEEADAWVRGWQHHSSSFTDREDTSYV
ncbi:hypothetical protein LXM25_00580 [Dyadobacter sp. LJ53]|uniref:hypothetical protein n=1 Tax=Dyadobacter chenwenxiniae TaxID=2906456 RepID=UPI001F3807BC|nr:hypothetical protein [Dyadobacter chenwenxiniae]MCF0048527.1 hypothetical protein [Dyadobacter chenwenxiniae]